MEGKETKTDEASLMSGEEVSSVLEGQDGGIQTRSKFERVGLLLQVIGSCCLSLVSGMSRHEANAGIGVDTMVLWQSLMSMIVGMYLQTHFKLSLCAIENDHRREIFALGILQYMICAISSYVYTKFELTEATIVLLAATLSSGLLGTKILVKQTPRSSDIAYCIVSLVALFFVQAAVDEVYGLAICASIALGMYYAILFKLNEVSMLSVYVHMSTVSFAMALFKSIFFSQSSLVEGPLISLILMGIFRALGQIALLRGYQFENNPIAAAMVFF
ncbi:hypothetical protein THRCLA_10573, partial [Thraustotheca clavata]